LGDNSAGTATYDFSEPGTFTFACQVGSHCDAGQIITVHVAAATAGTNTVLDWVITEYDDMNVAVGDSLTFTYNAYHNVYLHPSGSCDTDGATLLGDNSAGTATYDFSEPGTFTFACQVGSHCDAGQIITVHVEAATPQQCPLLVDVRSQAEWDEGHISCASRVEWDADDLVAQVMALAAAVLTTPVVTYCDTGGAAAMVLDQLNTAGFTDVTNGGGIRNPADVAAMEEMCSLCGTEACVLPADSNDDGVVNVADLLALLSVFGSQDSSGHNEVREDVNMDGIVDVSDILQTLSAFGSMC